MATTQPIRNMEDLDALKNYYLTQKPNLRNYALICTGINTALRIGDILHLVWADVFDFDANAFRKHLVVTERKTGKKNMIVINDATITCLVIYKYIEAKKRIKSKKLITLFLTRVFSQ